MSTHATAESVRHAVAAAWFTTVVLTTAACASTTSHAGTSSSTPSQASQTSQTSQTAIAGSPPASPTSAATTPTSTSAPAPTTPPSTKPPTSSTTGASRGCLASQLAGRWTYVVGSAGMGQISSDLSLKNTSVKACTISGYPAFTLYSAAGTRLPTQISFYQAPVSTLTVLPGGWVHSELRYSSDIPGGGEPPSGPCEPKASYALVTISGSSGAVRAYLDTPQPICSKGHVEAKPYAAGPSSPASG